MKKIFTFMVSFLFAGSIAFAQDEDLTTLQFVDAEGNVIENGSTLKINVADEDAFGSVSMETGLYVKNNTDSKVTCNIAFTVSNMQTGELEVCFPTSCQMAKKNGSYETTIGDVKASTTVSTMSKWLPEEYGKCTMEMQLLIQKKNAVTGKYSIKAYGPTVICEFDYNENSAIDDICAEQKNVKAYNILGQLVDDNYKGLVIVNGKKMIRK